MIINNIFINTTNKKHSMGTVVIELKIMPEFPDTDLEAIKKEILNKLPEALNIKIEEREIAFGLKSLKVNFAWPEERDSDEIENKLNEISGVSSAKIEDVRRAFG